VIGWGRRVVYRHWQSFHGVRRLELLTLRAYLDLSPGQRILDLGSGKGAFCGVLAREGLEPVGIDPSAAAVAAARAYVDPGGRFAVASGEELPLAPDQFDRAVSVCVLEHTEDDARVLEEVRRVLKPGGIFALTVDCLNSPWISEAFRRGHVRQYRCHHLYDEVTLRERLAAAGFETLRTRYLFSGRLAVAVLRWGSRHHYRGPFILLFPLLYPILRLDHLLGRDAGSGMVLAALARKAS
jgi:SAM-dependent methyltransferase